jgi:hypothetical protein
MSVIIEDGVVVEDTVQGVLWAGFFSVARSQGRIMDTLRASVPPGCIVIVPKCDGNPHKEASWATEVQRVRRYAQESNKKFIVGVLSNKMGQEQPDTNYLYLPLDDGFFEHGTDAFLRPLVDQIPWEQRSPTLCWRGSCSGGGVESVRVRFVDTVFKYDPNTDVRLSRQWGQGKGIPDHLFAEESRDRIHFSQFFRHKIFFIVDGNVIASNHMYGFGSGGIPFLLSDGLCWFSRLIVPYFHYVPVHYDLSNLVEQIEWVQNNDEKAKAIALNALAFSSRYFSSEYQKRHIHEKLRLA